MIKTRKEFPVLRNQIYVNTPVYGPFYDSLLEWRQEHDLDFLLEGSAMRERSLKIISDTRTRVGTYFGCKRKNVALVHNFSIGLNLLLDGMQRTEKILVLKDDYPSVNWPFESRGFNITYATIDENLETNILEKLRKEKCTVLAVSIVQWQNGLKVDLEFLKKLKEEFPEVLIIADGTQYCGTENFDFDNSAIDVLGASAYKWLLSGYGNGFLLFKDKVQERIDVRAVGFNGADGDFEKKESLRFAKRFEAGHLSCLSFGSMKFSIDFLERIGKDDIDAQNKLLSKKAKAAFAELGLLPESILNQKSHSTIFNIKGDDAVFHHLMNNDVLCAQRGEGIRMGFHFYNTESEIDEITAILKKIK